MYTSTSTNLALASLFLTAFNPFATAQSNNEGVQCPGVLVANNGEVGYWYVPLLPSWLSYTTWTCHPFPIPESPLIHPSH